MTRRRRIIGGLTATALLAPAAIGALAPTAIAGNDKGLAICHATGSAKNPYVLIHPANAGKAHGHIGDHHHGARDIVPPFQYKGQTWSQNWDEEGQAIFDNGCQAPTEQPPELLTPPVEPPAAEEPPPPPAEEEPPPVEEEPETPVEDPPTGVFSF